MTMGDELSAEDMEQLSPFWQKALACKHERTRWTNRGGCWTPLCGGWDEYHCLECGVYITRCDCGTEDGMSGWPHKRWQSLYERQNTKEAADAT